MRYSALAEMYERLEGTAKKLEKRDILAELYRDCSDSELRIVVLLSMGTVATGQQELGIAGEMMRRVIMRTYGADEKDAMKKFRETGDLGLTAEFFVRNRRQRTLAKKELTAGHVFDNLQKLSAIAGGGSQEKKVALVSELLSSASPTEARYIVRTVLGEMRVGVAAGIVRDAIAKAFGKEPKDVERLFNVIPDYGKVAELVKKGRMRADVIVGVPVRVMLAERAEDLKSAISEFDNPAIETKYDGFRIAVHKSRDGVKIFSRRLDDVTNQFPEIAQWSRELIKARECIVEGEAVAIDKEGEPLPFQRLSRRIQRKYDIDKMVKEIPVQVNLFDMIFMNGRSWMGKPLKERWGRLVSIISVKKGKFQLAEHIETKDFEKAERFYRSAIAEGQEGVIIKNLDAAYQPGKRVGYWLKVKDILEPLDLVVVGAEWGEGKRAKFLGSLVLAARKGDKFLETGMMGSGLTEKQLQDITEMLKPLITEEHGKRVHLKPHLVVEVGYEEIQKSPKYPTGYALRFPRLLRVRTGEKKPEDVNTTRDIERLFRQQK